MRATSRVLAAIGVALLTGLGAVGCAADAAPTTTEAVVPVEPAPDEEAGAPVVDEQEPPDDPVDPVQDTRRGGIATNFGGPAHGDQGTTDEGDGTWCQTVALFWGAPVPDGVKFTVEDVGADGPGLSIGPGECGDQGTHGACIGLPMWHDDQTLFCSIPLSPADGFENGIQLVLVGTLECTVASDCDEVLDRPAGTGPPIFVCDPEFVAEGNACNAATRAGG